MPKGSFFPNALNAETNRPAATLPLSVVQDEQNPAASATGNRSISQRPIVHFVVGTLFLGLIGLWAGGVFKLRTANGTVIIENVPNDATVTVDGEAVTLERDGKSVTVTAVSQGSHTLRVVAGDSELRLSDATVTVSGVPVRVRVEAENRKTGVANAGISSPSGDRTKEGASTASIPTISPTSPQVTIIKAPGAKPTSSVIKADTPASSPSAKLVAQNTRNPFGVRDVFDPDGADVKTFAKSVSQPEESDDPNSRQWVVHVQRTSVGPANKIEGEWASRWRGGTSKRWQDGTATVREENGRMFILFRDPEPSYLIEALRDGPTRLVGRYVNLKTPRQDNSPWVGFIVGVSRIDGVWSEGRWDLRRLGQ